MWTSMLLLQVTDPCTVASPLCLLMVPLVATDIPICSFGMGGGWGGSTLGARRFVGGGVFGSRVLLRG
jgi:hypothetical protein